MAYQYMETLSGDTLARFKAKLVLIGLDTCPYKLPGDQWVCNPKEWPSLEYHDVYHYLIDFPRVYSREAMKNYRSLEAYRWFSDRFDNTIYHIQVGNHVIMRAEVKPSYRVTEEPHHPWVALTNEGTVVAAHCDCMAGLGETCSHVGALLFKAEAAVRLGYTSSACTDEACRWNDYFVKTVEPAKIGDIVFYKDAAKDKLSAKRFKRDIPTATSAEEAFFLQGLAMANSQAVGLSAFATHNQEFIMRTPIETSKRLPQPLRELFSETNASLSSSERE